MEGRICIMVGTDKGINIGGVDSIRVGRDGIGSVGSSSVCQGCRVE